MSHLAWNCQGLGRALTVQKLRELIRSHVPSMVFLMEIKQNCHGVNSLRRQCGYYKGICVDPVGLAGGLALWWKPEVEVEILTSNKNMVDTIVNCREKGTQYRISWVYGPPISGGKSILLGKLGKLCYGRLPPVALYRRYE